MKRSISNRSDAAEDQVTDFGGISLATVANYLMLLSQQASAHNNNVPSSTATASPALTFFDSSCPATSSDHSTASHHHHHHHQPHQQPRVFECKTCNRQFPSFQALGGHRASHKKPRLSADPAASGSQLSSDSNSNNSTSPPKPKTHECSICGLEFPIGQALGGHMRRHRAVLYGDHHNQGGATAAAASSSSSSLPPPAPSTALSLSLKLAGAGAATPKPDATANKSLTMTTTAAVEMLRRSASGRNLCLDLNLTPLENGLDQIGKMAPIFG